MLILILFLKKIHFHFFFFLLEILIFPVFFSLFLFFPFRADILKLQTSSYLFSTCKYSTPSFFPEISKMFLLIAFLFLKIVFFFLRLRLLLCFRNQLLLISKTATGKGCRLHKENQVTDFPE